MKLRNGDVIRFSGRRRGTIGSANARAYTVAWEINTPVRQGWGSAKLVAVTRIRAYGNSRRPSLWKTNAPHIRLRQDKVRRVNDLVNARQGAHLAAEFDIQRRRIIEGFGSFFHNDQVPCKEHGQKKTHVIDECTRRQRNSQFAPHGIDATGGSHDGIDSALTLSHPLFVYPIQANGELFQSFTIAYD